MVLPNGNTFSVEDIKKNKPVVLIYFAPDCDHCKLLMKDFFTRVNDFSGAEVIMISYKPLKDLVRFVNTYNVGNYPNIKVGMELPVYFIRYYFNLTNTPFTALYNKKMQLVHYWQKETAVADMISRVQELK